MSELNPRMLSFTGLSAAAHDLLNPRKLTTGIIPRSWDRYQFTKPMDGEVTVYGLDRWIAQNMNGRWASYVYYVAMVREVRIVVRFELPNDALMFKLKDGENEAFE